MAVDPLKEGFEVWLHTGPPVYLYRKPDKNRYGDGIASVVLGVGGWVVIARGPNSELPRDQHTVFAGFISSQEIFQKILSMVLTTKPKTMIHPSAAHFIRNNAKAVWDSSGKRFYILNMNFTEDENMELVVCEDVPAELTERKFKMDSPTDRMKIQESE